MIDSLLEFADFLVSKKIKYEDAEIFYRSVINKIIQFFPEENESLCSIYNNYANILLNLNKLEEA
jgi:hypothetical protein